MIFSFSNITTQNYIPSYTLKYVSEELQAVEKSNCFNISFSLQLLANPVLSVQGILSVTVNNSSVYMSAHKAVAFKRYVNWSTRQRCPVWFHPWKSNFKLALSHKTNNAYGSLYLCSSITFQSSKKLFLLLKS